MTIDRESPTLLAANIPIRLALSVDLYLLQFSYWLWCGWFYKKDALSLYATKVRWCFAFNIE